MTDDQLEYLLNNWARWVSDRKLHETTSCKSFESRYRSPQVWHPPEARPPEIEIFKAADVEKIVVYLGSKPGTKKYKEILVGHYVYKARPESVSRRARIRLVEYPENLKMARLIVRNRLKEK